jgi:hypothetical protein
MPALLAYVCYWGECVAKARFVAGVVATGILTLGFFRLPLRETRR